MRCAVLDWMTYPQPIPCDLLLLSDVNYDPAVGEALKALVDAYRKQQTQILLTTPQRPAGRAFAMDIAEWADRTVDVQVQDETGCVDISLFNIDSAGRDRSFTLA
jgi:predicted nicotinamide N-methyase